MFLKDVSRSHTAANVILATMINHIRDAFEGGLRGIEWIVMFYLVMVSGVGLLPWRWDMLYHGWSSLGWSLILLCIPWLNFEGIDQEEGCELHICDGARWYNGGQMA